MLPSTASKGDIALALMVELGGVLILTLIAGINDEVANIVLLFLIGLWILWLIKHATETGYLNQLFARVQKATAG